MEYSAPKSGPERFERWKSTLFVDPDASNEEAKFNYFKLRESLADKFAKVSRVSPGCDGEIMRDVIRTFQKQRFFQRGQPGQRMLLHILFGLAAARPDVGYCQGMNYVVASLLLGRIPEQYTDIDHCTPVPTDNEEATEDSPVETPEDGSSPVPVADEDADHSSGTSGFEVAASVVRAVIVDSTNMSESQMDEAEVDVFLFMMELLSPQSKLDMAGMWKERIPKLKLRIYQLDRLLRWSYPQLHAHFTAIELSPEVITAQWFLTLFTYTFPVVPTVLLLWDYIFLTGWEGLFKVALSVLGSLQSRLLELEDFESIVMLMREWKREGTLIITESMDALLSRASKFVVNKEVLDKLQESFASEILTIALIRAQFLNDERLQAASATASGISSLYGSSAYSAIASITGSGKDRSHSNSTSPVPYTGSMSVNASGSDVMPLSPVSAGMASLSASYNTNYSMDNASSSVKAESSPKEDNIVSYSAESSAKQQASSGLQSLSQTERRKEMQRIQDREMAIEAQIMSGAEAPVFWLLRYGSKLPEKTLQELRKIKLDLLALDDQVDVDKQQIQAKIIKACEMNRETQDELSAAEAAMHEASGTVEQGKVSLQSALMLARQIALEVVELMEGTSNTGPTATVTGEGNHHSEGGSIIEHGSIPAFGSYGGGTSVTNTSLFSSSGNNHNHNHNNSSSYGSHGSGDTPSVSSSPGAGLIRFPGMLSGPWAKRHANQNDKDLKSHPEKFTSLHSYSPSTTSNSTNTANNTANIASSNNDINRGRSTMDDTLDSIEASIYSDTLSARTMGTDYTNEAPINTQSLFLAGEESDYDDFDSAGIADSLGGLKVSTPDNPSPVDHNTAGTYSNNSSNNNSTPGSARNSNSSNSSSPARPSNTDNITHPPHTTNYHHSYSSNNSGSSSVGIAHTSESGNSSSSNQHGKKASGGLLSSLSMKHMHWNFPVVRAVHHAAGIPCDRLHIGTSKDRDREVSAKLTTKQMKQLERRGQWAQQQIIDIDRALEESKRGLEFARKRLEQAKISNDETVTWKNSLCDQLHLLVRDSNRGRSQKLMFVAENYNI